MQQQRFLIAIVISAAILFGWNYFFPIKGPQQNQNNNTSASQEQANSSPAPQAQQTTSNAAQQTPPVALATAQESAPQRKVLISSSLYDIELDSRGAVATSWILKKTKDPESGTERDIFSVAGNKQHPQRLELISQEGRKRDQSPLRLSVGDENVDAALASRNYAIGGAQGNSGDIKIELARGESKTVEFTLHDDATGIDVTKSVTFHGDSFLTEVCVKLARNGQAVPQAKLIVGPSIGDQGVARYTFYSVAPEGITAVGSEKKAQRLQAAPINQKSADHQAVAGDVDWAGVGDTYFAMLAVPAQPTQGLEYRTAQYDHEAAGGKKESRYLISAYVPVPADGSPTIIYAGPKDHYLLDAASSEIGQKVGGRKIDLEQAIDYGWLSWLSRPLAVPILKSIKVLSALTGSYGVAIILFTIVIYSLFFPLKWRSSKAMKKAQKLAPRMKELQEKIKGMKQNDPRLKELQMEQLRLMKEGNPLGGCLPLLIQMPFLFALYRAITISLDFRQASFLWLPDLSAGDPFHLLEILMAGSMMVLQLITPQPQSDPVQRKMMAIGMPLFMLYVLWGAPSGLLVYWLVGNIVGFSQQFLINRLTKSDDEEPPQEKKVKTSSTKKLSTAGI